MKGIEEYEMSEYKTDRPPKYGKFTPYKYGKPFGYNKPFGYGPYGGYSPYFHGGYSPYFQSPYGILPLALLLGLGAGSRYPMDDNMLYPYDRDFY